MNILYDLKNTKFSFKTLSSEELETILNDLSILKHHSSEVPCNLDLERSVLVAFLTEEGCQDNITELKIEDFYDESHIIAFIYMKELMIRDIPTDIHTITDHVISDKGIPGLPREFFVTFSDYFTKAIGSTGVMKNIPIYIRLLKDKTRLRKLLLASLKVGKLIDKKSLVDPDNIIKEAHEYYLQAFDDNVTNGCSFRKIDNILESSFNLFLESYNNENSKALMTGFEDLDRLIGGLLPGQFYIIAGRPAMGKTTLAMNIMENILSQYVKLHSLLFSLEMSAKDIASRMVCSLGQISKSSLKQGSFMRIDNLNRAQQAYDLIRNLGLYVHDSPSLDLMQLISNCKKFYKMHGSTMGIIVLDYIQLMPAMSTDKGINRTQEIADISRSLKSLARELSVPVVAISQLNRNVDERIDKRPTLSDLRESGALEQDADVVIFIYRDEIYNKYSTEKNLAEIIIGKHRNGPIGKILTSFNPSYSCFSNYNENEKIEELYLEDVLI